MFPSSSVFAGLSPHWSSRATVGEAGVAEEKKEHNCNEGVGHY